MKKILLFFIAMFFIAEFVEAQDIIIPKDKSKSKLTVILIKVSQASSGVVEYKYYNNQEGPTYSMPWSQISMIIPETGETMYPPVEVVENNEYKKSGEDRGNKFKIGVIAGLNFSNFSYKHSGSFVGSVINYGYNESIGETPSYKSGTGFNLGVTVDVRLNKSFYLKSGLIYSNQKVSNSFSALYSYYKEYSDMYLIGTLYDDYTEKYNLNYLEIPVLFSYYLPLNRSGKFNMQFNVGPVIGIGLTGKCNFTGTNSSQGYNLEAYSYNGYYISNYGIDTKYDGYVDLFGGDGSYDYVFITETEGTEDIECENSYQRLNLGLNFGVDVEIYGVSVGFAYVVGLNNYANDSFWSGDRAIITDYISSDVSGYKQRTNSFMITMAYKFAL
jgi:hypothetical protein